MAIEGASHDTILALSSEIGRMASKKFLLQSIFHHGFD